jgi:tRNA U55 pseudouridine synthase TruB
VTIEELKSADMEELNCKGIHTKDNALSWMPELKIEMSLVQSIKNGMPIEVSRLSGISDEIKSARGIRIKSPDDELLAVASYQADKERIKMDVVFA